MNQEENPDYVIGFQFETDKSMQVVEYDTFNDKYLDNIILKPGKYEIY